MTKVIEQRHFIQIIRIKIYLLIPRTAITAFAAFKLVGVFNDWKVHVLFYHQAHCHPEQREESPIVK